MIRPHLPLNGLRAFEAAARHLSFTNASVELHVTPAALSHQVKALEDRLGFALFHRLPRGLALTDEGVTLLPVLRESLDQIALVLEHLRSSRPRHIVTIGVVGTFALSWLIPRLHRFDEAHPDVELRFTTNNNRVDLADEGLDLAIRFGDGAWNGTASDELLHAPFAPLCAPVIASRLSQPADLVRERLLRSYRVEDWRIWFEAAAVDAPPIRGPIFDSARLMVDAAMSGYGVALAPPRMFEEELAAGILRRPFELEVDLGSYWLTHLKSKTLSPGMGAFRTWLLGEARSQDQTISGASA